MAGTNSQKQSKKRPEKNEKKENETREQKIYNVAGFRSGRGRGGERGRFEDATLYKAVWGRAITLRCVGFVLCFGFVVAIKYIITVS